MATNYMKDVMKSMGWSDGSFLPIANAENKKILEEINNLGKNRTEKETLLRNIEERANKIEEHFRNAESYVEQNLKLLTAHRSEVTTESHMYKICERINSKIEQDMNNLCREIGDIEKYENKTEKQVKRFQRNIENLTAKIAWAKSALFEWQDAMDKGDETNNLIEKYCKDDEHRASTLDNKRRILQDQINKQRKILIELYEDEKAMEKSLDRTAELYRQTHIERRNMVETWKDAVNQMNQREKDIEMAEDALDDASIEKDDRLSELKDQEGFLNQLIANNKEVELSISDLNEETSLMRKRYDDLVNLTILRDNENQILKKQVQGIAGRIQQKRMKNKQNTQEKADKEIEIYKVEQEIKNLQIRLKKFVDKHSSTSERLNMIEEMIDTEEKVKQQLSIETTRINGLFFRSQEHLVSLKDDEKLLEAENKGLESTISGIKRNISDTHKVLNKTIEDEYDLGIKVQILEIKIVKMQGGVIDDDEQLKNEQLLHKLEKEAEVSTKQLANIQAQIEKLDSDMKKLTIIYNDDAKEIEKLSYKIKESQLYVEIGERQIKTLTQEHQEKIVDLSILKMRIYQMETQISKCNDKVYNLEKHRIELEKAMNERMLDLKIQTEVLQTKRKHLQEERSAYKMDLAERQVKIDASNNRYTLCLDLLGKNEDGTLITATQLKVATAQEKQFLLHDGNELNEKVLKAEHEIKQMENTLCLLNYSNDSYRRTFEKLDDKNIEIQELEKLQKTYCQVLGRLKNLKQTLHIRAQEIDVSIENREILEKNLEELIRARADNAELLLKIHKELLVQKTKLQRAEREIKVATKDVRQRCFNPTFLVTFEKDLFLKELDQRNASTLQLIADFIDANHSLASDVTKLLEGKGLKLPQQQVKKTRSSSSWRSEFSEFSFTASSKANSTCLSVSSRSSKCSDDTDGIRKGAGSSRPSVVSIDFPMERTLGQGDIGGVGSAKARAERKLSKTK